MSNSSLVSYTALSPWKNSPRNASIDTITIHCAVDGNKNVDFLCRNFTGDRQVSCNYAIGADGKIGLVVPESDRSWCSSSGANDHRAITIECSSDLYSPYRINGKVWKALIELCADICKRNNIKKLLWKGDKSLIGKVDQQNITCHRWFNGGGEDACPGPYIYENLGKIADEVNTKLGVTDSKYPEVPFLVTVIDATLPIYKTPNLSDVTRGVTGRADFTIIETNGEFGKLKSGAGWIVLTDSTKCRINWDTSKASNKTESFMVRVSVPNLNIRKGPGTNYDKAGPFIKPAVYTIVETAKGPGSASGWGKLKSGAGWIALDHVTRV